MAVTEERTGLEVISPVGCDRHLRTEQVGRVALMVDNDHPEIFPVNYAIDAAGDLFFRTDGGTKLDAVAKAPTIALEIDGIDDERHLGWSVLVVGQARHLGLPDDIANARALLQPWPAGEKTEVVRLRPTKISGRRIDRSHPHLADERAS